MNRKSIILRPVTSLVLMVYLLGSNSVLIPLVEYMVDYNTIANEKCENIAVPEKGCHGKCYLKKQIGKAVDVEEPSSDNNRGQLKQTVDPHEMLSQNQLMCFDVKFSPGAHHSFFTDYPVYPIDHPPQC